MIADKLENASKYFNLGKKLKKGFEFLQSADLKNLDDGKYEIDGSEIFANVQTLKTKSENEKKWEVHRKYIDIQYVIKGRERMGFGLLDDFKTEIEKYDETKDVEFLDGKKFNFLNVSEGEFVVFYPQDVHAPMLCANEPENIKKVIVKIKI